MHVHSRRITIVLLVCAALTGLGMFAVAQEAPMERTIVRPSDLHFVAKPNGTFQANIVGNVERAGTYAAQTRLPAGLRIAPHFHPEDRMVLIMSGTLYVGYGETYDETKMMALSPGSVFTEPGRTPHFTWAKDGEVNLYVTGRGPTGTTWLDKKK